MFQREKLSKLVQKDIAKRISKREFKPGVQLPTEKELIEEYDVGRYTIREALKGLESKKIIEIKKGIGTFVSHLDEDNYLNYPLETLIVLHESDDCIIEMLELRKILEIKSAELAAKRIKDEELSKLEKLLYEMKNSFGNSDSFSENDKEFHLTIVKSTDNIFIAKVLGLFAHEIRENIKTMLSIPKVNHSAFKWHSEIYNSLKKHDPEKSALAMKNHLDSLLDFYLKNYY